jgi:hypothetical protein
MTESNDNRALDWFTPCRFGVLLAVLVFASFPQVILGLQTFVFRDYGFFAYPLAHFQRDCFWRGEIPLWNPYNFCGIPFLAQWNTMPLYPPSLIYLTLPLQWSLGFFCLLHLWFAGLGMFFLARRWTGLRRAEVSASLNGFNSSPASVQLSCNAATATQAGSNFAAAFAGTVFAFNGFTLNLLMWPSHLATFAGKSFSPRWSVRCRCSQAGRKSFSSPGFCCLQFGSNNSSPVAATPRRQHLQRGRRSHRAAKYSGGFRLSPRWSSR